MLCVAVLRCSCALSYTLTCLQCQYLHADVSKLCMSSTSMLTSVLTFADWNLIHAAKGDGNVTSIWIKLGFFTFYSHHTKTNGVAKWKDQRIPSVIKIYGKPPRTAPNRGIAISHSVQWCHWAQKDFFPIHWHKKRDRPNFREMTSFTIRIWFIRSDNIWKV